MVSSPFDEIASHICVYEWCTVLPNESQIIFAINMPMPSKAGWLVFPWNYLPSFLRFLNSIVNWIWNLSQRVEKGDEIAKIPKNCIGAECDNWFGVWILPAIAKIIAKQQNRIKDRLMGREALGFCYGSSCSDHIHTFRIIVDQCPGFKSPLHLLFFDFVKAFDSVNRKCIWYALSRGASQLK